MFTRRVLLLLLLFVTATGTVVLLSFNPAPPFHTQEELDALRSGGNRSPIDSGEYFLGSVRCQGCHGYDTLRHANVDLDTNDVNLYSDWQSSMMALSAKDPLWRAKVSQEILTNPAHANELQTKCTACHAPPSCAAVMGSAYSLACGFASTRAGSRAGSAWSGC